MHPMHSVQSLMVAICSDVERSFNSSRAVGKAAALQPHVGAYCIALENKFKWSAVPERSCND
jgi:hypothetical protein